MQTVYIEDLNPQDDFKLITDSQDIISLKEQYPSIPGLKKYDSFLYLVRWDVLEIWGFYGCVPYLHKNCYLVHQEKTRMNPNRLSNYATAIYCDPNDAFTAVVYHRCTIVQWTMKTIILRNDGYFTSTTKRKMNQASNQFNLGFHVYQEDFTWYVTYKGKTIPFKDEMRLDR